MLTPTEKDEVFARMKILFSDITYLPEVEPKLQQAINECDRIELSFTNVKNFARRFYETGRYETEDEKKKWREIQWIFATCCVLIVTYQDRAKTLFWHSVEKLVNAYPMFSKLADKDELELLLKFRNMLVAATLVLNPRLNKELIIFVAGRLEGTQRRYITGKGQRDAVSMRVKIYEQEGQITPEVRPYRSNPEKLNEKRALMAINDLGKSKKKRQEFQKSMLPTNTVAMRPFPTTGQLPTVDMGLMSGHRPELPPQYLLSSGSVLSVFDRERAIRNAAYNNTLTPSNTSHIYHGGPGAALSDLTQDSKIKTEWNEHVRKNPQPKIISPYKKEHREPTQTHFGMLLASAESMGRTTLEQGPYLNPIAHIPFPSLSQTSLPSLSFDSLPSSSSSPRGNLSSLAGLSAFPSRLPMSCPTDVLLDPALHQQASLSDEWQNYPPYLEAPTFAVTDPMHPYRLQGINNVSDTDCTDSLRSGMTTKDNSSTNSRPEHKTNSIGAHQVEESAHPAYHSDLLTLAAVALSNSNDNGLPW